MGKTSPAAVVLDAGALIEFERAKLIVPAGVLGQVWRDGARQVPLRALLLGETTSVPALDQVMAQAAGVLCGCAGTSDVIDATVALTARRERATVVTTDVDDIRRLDPTLRIERV
jgi:predicted nucleic acid-binding protein